MSEGTPLAMGCELCEADGGRVLWRDHECRIVRVPSVDYPGFLRVILNRHVREMTDLDPSERERLMRAVFAAAPRRVRTAPAGAGGRSLRAARGIAGLTRVL